MAATTARKPGRKPTAVLAEETPQPKPTRPTAAAPRLQAGQQHMSPFWLDQHGARQSVDFPVPVHSDTLLLAGQLWVCPAELTCGAGQWVLDGDKLAQRFCGEHGVALVVAPLGVQVGKSDDVEVRQSRAARALAARRQAMAEAIAAKSQAHRDRMTAQAQSTAKDLEEHVPSLVATGATLVGATFVVSLTEPLASTAIGVTTAIGGAVVAYLAAYLIRKQRAVRRGQRINTPGARALVAARRDARRVAVGAMAAGSWTALASVSALNPDLTTWAGTGMIGLGLLLGWLVNRAHWRELTAKVNARKAAQLAAEAWAQRLADGEAWTAEINRQMIADVWDEAWAEHARLTEMVEVIDNNDDPKRIGAWLAAEWQRIVAEEPDVQQRFPVMGRTRILVDLTRAVTAPIDGEVRRIGWEFVIEGEPGVLVPPLGASESPLSIARRWLAAILRRDPLTVSTVDSPGGDANRALLLLSDGAPLGELVRYQGRDGIQYRKDGSIWAHDGRDITGKETYEPLYIPQQKYGGLVVGHSGGGKTASIIRRILSSLYAGILPFLYDPKNFVDYAEFAGIFPMGCTKEHRDLLLNAIYAEMLRRQQHLATRKVRDKHGRLRPTDALWDIKRDGPPMLGIWDEFHLESQDRQFVTMLTALARLERATASGNLVASQGGGLVDFGDSVFRGLLNQTGMEIFRMPLSQARLAGYSGEFDPSHLPHLPGMLVKVIAEGTVIPMRSAYVPRGIDDEDSVYDHLYAPDGSVLLSAPKLPAETLEVFEREGLMDLWRLAQGEGGLDRLQAESLAIASTVPPAREENPEGVDSPGKKFSSKDMVLAVLATAKAHTREGLVQHPLWHEPVLGWGGRVNPTTITRASSELIEAGLITKGATDQQWRALTPKGHTRAVQVLQMIQALTRPSGSSTPGAASGETTADMEHRLQTDLEREAVIRQSLQGSDA